MLLLWLTSYLNDRTCQIRIKNEISSSFSITSGVPQGSNIGPILFNSFVNDILSALIDFKILSNADDIHIFTKITSGNDAEFLQVALNEVATWSSQNGLKLNIAKCNIICFYRGSSCFLYDYLIGSLKLNRVNFIKDLGVIFMDKLSFCKHLEMAIFKAFKMLCFIFRNTASFKTASSLITLYRSLVLLNLLYWSLIWSPYQIYLTNLLELVQHKFLRDLSYKFFVPMTRFDHNYSSISKQVDLFSNLLIVSMRPFLCINF